MRDLLCKNVYMENEEVHFVGNVAQKAIIEKDAKILVCRGMGDSVWEFPGGRLHEGELPQDGVMREIKEELGVSITVHEPLHVCRSHHKKANKWNTFIAYRCSLEEEHIEKANLEEIEEATWVSLEELKNLPMFDDCREAADVFLKTKHGL